ncbi:hypothetical protein DVH24_002173 [Malus domestica]|uniref:Ribosomal eL28/Mak16 domain-containing protein n=1 Tax=Malus domestica TaxID=3750 RepID=A0A498I9D0_MALDO|nr:hypothetical protein DVH24_002173 [Malus domestica]
MATVLGQLIWEIVKKNNSFLVKKFERSHVGVRFTKEPNNLLNLHSYKHSGLANKKIVTIQGVGKDQSVLLAISKTKKQNKPAVLLHKFVMKHEFRRMAKAVANQFYAVVITFVMRESETVPVRRVCSTGDLDLQTINSMHSNGGKWYSTCNMVVITDHQKVVPQLHLQMIIIKLAEQVSAGWSSWLNAAAGETIYGWIPSKLMLMRSWKRTNSLATTMELCGPAMACQGFVHDPMPIFLKKPRNRTKGQLSNT